MRIPGLLTGWLPVLALLEEDWEPVSPFALAGWLAFYAILLLGAAAGGGLLRWFDLVFVPVHEAGPLLFSRMGMLLMVAG